MQRSVRQLTYNIFRASFVKRNNCHGNKIENKIDEQEVISYSTPEEIIAAQRAPDISIDLMQQQTIKEILARDNKTKSHQDKREKANIDQINKS